MAYQATPSLDGKIRYSVYIEYRIEKTMVDWICQQTGWGMQQTLGWIRKQIAAHDNWGWYGPFWSFADKEIQWLNNDDIRDQEDHGEGRGYHEG